MPSLPPLVEAMRQPSFYPDCPGRVELRQTHISYVFLAGEFVYKVKKPVRFTFLDYSTLHKRHHFCQEEVRLNRRLAPAIYMSVLPIVQRQGNFVLGGGVEEALSSEVAEYAVKMRRLPEDRMLDALVQGDRVGEEEIDAITQKLATFHGQAASDRAAVYGAPAGIWKRLADNFRETERFIGRTIPMRRFAAVEKYSRRFMEKHRGIFKLRVQEGKIREGHGDLRAEHICLTDGIVVFDCIEFDERLRYCDVASEMAFLAMDLDFLGAPLLSRRLIATYAEKTQEDAFLTLLPFYQCYRAYVRGKVESLKSQEPEVPLRERERAMVQAERYFRLSHRYARGAPSPAILIVCGMVGTGKSTLARSLGDLSGFDLLNSDAVRKRLARIPKTVRATSGYRGGLYHDSFTHLTYSTLLAEAQRSLKGGRGVIVDATFKDPQHRRLFLQGAEELGAPVLFVECQTREQEIIRRLREREQQPEEVSDATIEVYLRQRDVFVSFSEMGDRTHLTVNTEKELEKSLEKIEEFLCNPLSRGN